MSSLVFGLCFLAGVQGALVQVTNFGSNPSALEMYIDLPDNVTSNAPVILAVSKPLSQLSEDLFLTRYLRSFTDVAVLPRNIMDRITLRPWASPEAPS